MIDGLGTALTDLVRSAAASVPKFAAVVVILLGGCFLGSGTLAALNPVGILPTVTTSTLVPVLATVGAVLVVSVGGGLTKPIPGGASSACRPPPGEIRNQTRSRPVGAAAGCRHEEL